MQISNDHISEYLYPNGGHITTAHFCATGLLVSGRCERSGRFQLHKKIIIGFGGLKAAHSIDFTSVFYCCYVRIAS
jgi:hypothetical protein